MFFQGKFCTIRRIAPCPFPLPPTEELHFMKYRVKFRNVAGGNERMLAAYQANNVPYPVTFTVRDGRGAPGPSMASLKDCCKYIWNTYGTTWRAHVKLNETQLE